MSGEKREGVAGRIAGELRPAAIEAIETLRQTSAKMAEDYAQLRRDRDELANHLEDALRWLDKLGAEAACTDARAYLARVRGRG